MTNAQQPYFQDVSLENPPQRDNAPNPYARQASQFGDARAHAVNYMYSAGSHAYATFENRLPDREALDKSRCGKWFQRNRVIISLVCIVSAITIGCVLLAVVPTSLLAALYRRLGRRVPLALDEQWGDTLFVGASAEHVVEHVVEPNAKMWSSEQMRTLFDALGRHTDTTHSVKSEWIKRGFFEWTPLAGRRANATTSAVRNTLSSQCEASSECECVSYFHYGLEYNAVYVSARGLRNQLEEGAMIEVGTDALSADDEFTPSDGGVMLYNPAIVSQDDSVVKEVKHECEFRELLAAASRDGPNRVTPSDRLHDEHWLRRNVSALLQYVAHNGKVRRRRVFLPVFACIQHCIELVH